MHAECTIGTLYLDLLAWSEAQSHCDRAVVAAARTASLYWTRFSAALAAMACLERGDRARAELLLNDLVDRTRSAQTWAERMIWYTHARLALATGDAGAALQIAEERVRPADVADSAQPEISTHQPRNDADSHVERQ